MRGVSEQNARMSRAARLWPVLLLALLPALPLWRAVVLGEGLGPWDQVRQMAPWNGPPAPGAWDALQADGVLQTYAWRDLVFEAWRTGQLPLWNPYPLAGTPLLANSQSGGFYPPHILLGALGIPTTPGVTLLAWLHLAVAGIGAWALARRLGAPEEGAVLAGALFGVSPFLVSWAALGSVPSTVAWLPWGLLAALGLFGASAGSPSSVARATAGLAAATAMTLLGGHLQFAAYSLGAFLVMAGAIAIAQRAGRGLALATAGVGLGVALAAVQVVPVLQYGQQSHRRTPPTAEGWQAYSAGAFGPIELVGVAFPVVTGLPGQPLAAAPEERLPGYWPGYAKRGANFAEAAVGIGPALGLLFALRRPRPEPRQGEGQASLDARAAGFWGLVAVLAVGLGLALGPLSALLYFGVPGWAATGSPGRAGVLVVLATAVLAGLAWPRDEAAARRACIGIAILLALTLLGVFALAPASSSWAGALPIGDFASAQFSESMPAVLAGGVLVAVAALLASRGRHGFALASLLAATLACGPLGAATTGQVFLAREGQTDPNVRRAYVNSAWDIFRPAPALMPPNASTVLRVPEIGGYDSLVDRETVDLLKSVNGRDPAPPVNGNMMFVKPGFDAVRLSGAGVTEVWSREPLEGLGPGESRPGGVWVHALSGPGRASLPGGTARIVEDRFDRLSVEVTGSGPLTVRDRNMPGWVASIDGRPVPLPAGLWRTVMVPKGSRRVTFQYLPPGLGLGAGLSAAALCAVGALILVGRIGAGRKVAPIGPEKV